MIWPRASVDEVSQFVVDGTHGSPIRTETGIPVLSAQHVKAGRLVYETDRFTSKEEYDDFSRRVNIQRNDLLLTIVGTIGRAAIVDDVAPAVFQRSVSIIRPNTKRIDPRYFFHATQHENFQAQLIKYSNQSAQAGIYLGKLKSVDLPLPPLEEQRRIAAILDKANTLRLKRERVVDIIRCIPQSLFLQTFGDPQTNPGRWNRISPLSEVADISSGITKGRKEPSTILRPIPYLAVANVQDRALDLSNVKIINASEEEIRRFRLRSGDLVLTEGGDPDKLGRGTVWRDELPEVIHQNHIFRVRVDTREVDPLYLNFLIGSRYGKDYFLRSAKQTTGIASINKSQLSRFPVLIPPIELQRKFAFNVERLAANQGCAGRAYETMLDLFASLQHRAFSGQL